MAKRFFDTEKFNKPWYRRLTLLQKVIWEYLLSTCDHAGLIEKFDLDLMAFQIGVKEIKKSDLDFLKDKIQIVNDDTIFIPSFFSFQYGQFNPENKVHASVLKKLKKYNLAPSKGLTNPLQGAKDKDKEKEKDKDKDKEISFSGYSFSLKNAPEGANAHVAAVVPLDRVQHSVKSAPAIADFLLKTYPQSFKKPQEIEKYSCLEFVTSEFYDLDTLYKLIIRENPYKDFAPSPKFILNLLPRAKINQTLKKPPAQTKEEHEKGAKIARDILSKYPHIRRK